MFTQGTDPDPDKPLLLKAIELIVAGPADIQRRVEDARAQVLASPLHKDKNAEELRLAIADALIEHYAVVCGRVGALTSAAGAIPGLGTVIALVGASAADLAISMKYQIELVHALAALFGRDITNEEEQRLCYTIAGLGVATQAGLLAAERFTVNSILETAKRLAHTKLKRLVFDLFRKIGLKLTSKGLLRAIPLGVGAAFSYTSNKRLTRYVGRRARDFFLEHPPTH